MNNSHDSWSRCAKEFTTSALINKELQFTSEFTDSKMRPVHVKRLDFNNGLSSCRGLVATDIALANLEQIERNELVSKWIADGMCTPPISEQNTSYPSSPVFESLIKEVERLEPESFPTAVLKDLEKSPVIKCHSKLKTESKRYIDNSLRDFSRSPKIGKKRRKSVEKRNEFGSLVKRKLNDTQSSSPSDRSPRLGKRLNLSRKHRPKISRRRLQDRPDFDTSSSSFSLFKEKQDQSVFKSSGEENGLRDAKESKVVALAEVRGEIMISQDIFDDEIITASPRPEPMAFVEISDFKRETEEDLFCSWEEVKVPLERDLNDEKEAEYIVPESRPSPSLYGTTEYCSTPVVESVIKKERSFSEPIKVEENSFDSVIQDTEEFLLPQIQEKSCRDNNQSTQDDKFLILDSEFSVEKRKFVTDTERIDYDTSSENENEKDNPDLKQEKISTGGETDSDKTVSDIIEEPMTQDCLEPLKSSTIISLQSGLVSCCSRNSILAASPKISETISPKDPISLEISVADISVETTPPHTPESFAHAPDLLDSGKKKKSRPKRGSLGARLQKLISGEVSCVRLWRHQMSRESAFEGSSAPCTTLLVVDTWIEYGKNMHQSKIVKDPYDLLNDCFDESAQSEKTGKKLSRNLVVMTNPDFVGSVKLLPGMVFKIYLPWQIYNRNSGKGNLILQALYFNVISQPGKLRLESKADESDTVKHSNEITVSEVTREYNCPCLVNGKIDDSCLTKFTNHKVDIIAEIVKSQ